MNYTCPESMKDLEELEAMIPMCRIELFEQAKAKINSGGACSLHDVSRQLAEETGKNPGSIERSLQREQKTRGETLSPLSEKYHSDVIATKWTGDAESYTPSEYIEKARDVMGSIDTDPASNELAQKTVKAGVYYTEKEDGLNSPWGGNIFLNPPYNHGIIDKFIEKLINELSDTKQAILLTNNNTDTKWFLAAAKKCNLLCFTTGRINFYKEDGSKTSPTNGQCFFYFGKNKDKFKEIFSTVGLIMEVI